MKTRLNITIEEELLSKVKYYAQKHHTSVSEMVETYFRTLAKSHTHKSIIDLVEALPKTKIVSDDADLKDLYYKSKGEKYGL